MSASLVGSEMCIRDRCSTDWGAEEKRWPSGGCSWGERQPAATRRNPGAVSYTHLTLPTICSV
eukprot:11372368-Alexandrium_andersonii.AAC.1